MGQSPPGSTYNDTGSGLPFYQGRADFGARFPTRRMFCTAATRIAEAGDTLISVRAPVGDQNIATETCGIGRGVASIRHPRSPAFAYGLIWTLQPQLAVYDGDGTVFGSIGGDQLRGLRVVVPRDSAMECFEKIAGPMGELQLVRHREAITLAGLRDYLLPKLLSGEVRVRDAERLVSDVA